jgi:ribonuclease HI
MSRAASGRILHNCADIQAATECIRMAKGNGVRKLQINTDSEFLINAVTKWMERWKNNGWTTVDGDQVRNQLNFMRLNSMMDTSMDIKWNLVVDFSPSNVKATEMAEKAADEQRQVQGVDVGQLVYDYLFEDHYDYGNDYDYGDDYDAVSYDGGDSSFIDDSDVESGSNDTYSTAEENDE